MFRREQGEPKRFKRYRYGPLHSRLVVALASLLLGIVSFIVGLVFGNHGAFTWFDLGVFLVGFGVVGFLVGLYLDRKGD